MTAPFPRVFRVAIVLEVLERLAYYGVYINLAVYLTETIKLSDTENGVLLGWFAAVRSWLPIATGALSDRIGFRKSLALSFSTYILAYAALALFPTRIGAWSAVMAMAVGHSFLKPVIPAAVRRYSPDGREVAGFSIFYASVNAGSVIGKVGAKIVRTAISLQASIVNSVVACAVALGVTLFAFREPAMTEDAAAAKKSAPASPSFLASLREAGRNVRFIGFLVLISGYYLLLEQFYQTFPVYCVRQLGADVPREYITLINPAAIALLQVPMGHMMRRVPPLVAIPIGVFIGAISMLAMGAFPTLAGACVAFFVFAIAEMTMSPRYFQYVSTFAPKGREGLYMGMAFIPYGLGGLAGGVLSGRLIATYLPKGGEMRPLAIWGAYAAIGVGCAVVLAAYGVWAKRTSAAS